MDARLLIALLLPSAVLALEPTVLDESEAQRERDYIRRNPSCARSGSATATPSPKVLHQIWWQGEKAIPAEYAPMRASWAATNPTWTIKLWDEASATALINNSYAWFAPVFRQETPQIMILATFPGKLAFCCICPGSSQTCLCA